jgi:CRP-like cAMP-binding protein
VIFATARARSLKFPPGFSSAKCLCWPECRVRQRFARQRRKRSGLEVQRPALRLLRKLPKFGEVLDSTYRRNGRATTIQDIAAATQLSKEAVSQLEAISQFKVFGKNHVLFRAGDRMKNLFVLKSGWAKVTPRNVTRQLTMEENHPRNWNAKAAEAYFGPSHCFGVEAITRDGNWEQTCTLMGRAEVLEITLKELRKHPELREILLLAFTGMAAPDNPNEGRQPLPVAKAQESLIETGLVDATNLLVMDMDLCVRCGNCSMACHQVHGQSRYCGEVFTSNVRSSWKPSRVFKACFRRRFACIARTLNV